MFDWKKGAMKNDILNPMVLLSVSPQTSGGADALFICTSPHGVKGLSSTGGENTAPIPFKILFITGKIFQFPYKD
jgi:hypothetical protein